MLWTVAGARDAGISRGVLRGPQYQRVLGATYAEAHVAITPRLRAEAALLLAPAAVLSHDTAFGLWTGDDSPDHHEVVHISVERDPGRAVPRVRACGFMKYGTSTGCYASGCRSPRPSAPSSTSRRTATSPSLSSQAIRLSGEPA